ncbi:MAG: DUF4199 domain-containing protein [Bacteroides sp.]|nr:DUF4199 domain-containing protein [Bacteroides sp.]MBQ2858098.1 DUF4199 domain-containing protein [Bacteroidaceae bacterium]
MTEKKRNFQEDAMRYGTIMGIFWTLKFVLFPMGMTMPLLLMAFFLLTLIVPVAGFFLVRQYRDKECQGILSFSRAFLFTSFMYLFAALFATIVHYIYFRFMDNGLIVNTYQDMLNQMSTVATDDLKPSLEQFQQALDIIATLSPLEISIQLITQNIFYCTLIALPTAILVMRNPKKH